MTAAPVNIRLSADWLVVYSASPPPNRLALIIVTSSNRLMQQPNQRHRSVSEIDWLRSTGRKRRSGGCCDVCWWRCEAEWKGTFHFSEFHQYSLIPVAGHGSMMCRTDNWIRLCLFKSTKVQVQSRSFEDYSQLISDILARLIRKKCWICSETADQLITCAGRCEDY